MPWFFLGLGVIAISSAVSWLCNEATEHEKERQSHALQERDRLVSELDSLDNTYSELRNEQQKKAATELRKKHLMMIREHLKKIAPISAALNELFKLINNEIIADTTSPYRRSALQREFARIEDARARLVEYEAYLDYEKDTLNTLWKRKKFAKIIALAFTEPLLPDEWLYEGKVLFVDMSELGKPLPRFGHRLLMSGNRAQQQALAVDYGTEFPILVRNKGNRNDGAFFGCVARGICYVDHILKIEPAEMYIENYIAKDDEYKGVLFDGLLSVKLPKINLLDPSLKAFKGQKMSVYFDSYNMTLTTNPTEKASRYNCPSVSEKPPTFLGHDELDLYIEVEESLLTQITDDEFYADSRSWTLINCDIDSRELVLAKASVQLICEPTEHLDGLRVTQILQCNTTQIGVDLPFGFVLASKSLNPQQYFSWPYGLEQLYSFASQALIDPETMSDRLKQSKFFKQWEQVVQYQKKMESERSIEFECTPESPNNQKHQMVIGKSEIDAATIADKSITTQIKEIEKSEYLSLSRCCKLMVWDSTQERYVYAIGKRWVNETSYSLDKAGCLHISASLESQNKKISFDRAQKFKLDICIPNAALQRQEQALTALFEDRMVEPRLKDIFLSPSNYQPEFVEYWRNNDINWSGRLTTSQKDVVRTALSARHIAMVQGPPGTGKTTTIVEMLYQLISHNPNQRILVVSQQNTAVDNAIAKFKKTYPELVGSCTNIVRVGNLDKIDSSMKENHLDSVFESFISEKLDHVSLTAHTLTSDQQQVAYEWGALLRQMKEQLGNRQISDEFFTTMLADKNVIGATCVGLAGRKAGIDHLSFDVAIVDEAGRATVPELLIPLLRSKKAILIGDHHQLPPSIAPVLRDDAAKEEMAFLKETFLERSFFEHLFDELPNTCTASLKEQFRMSPPIGDMVADLFYTKNGERQLFNGAGDDFDSSQFAISDCLIWRDVAGKQHRPKNSTSIENSAEAVAIGRFLFTLSEKQKTSIDVAVITPYGAQKRTIRRELEQQGAKTKNGQITLNNLTIKVDTVDSFQGSEAEVVIYSTVRTEGSLQFLLDRKRLNVACSRAKQTLIFFGHSEFLKRWKPKKGEINLFEEILKYAQRYPLKQVA